MIKFTDKDTDSEPRVSAVSAEKKYIVRKEAVHRDYRLLPGFYTPEYAAKPASIGSTTPVIALAAFSSHKKNTPPKSSSLSTSRPIGIPLKI